MSLASTNRKSLFKSVKTPNKKLPTEVCILWINTEAVYGDENRVNNIKHYALSVNSSILWLMQKIIDLQDSMKLQIALCVS